MSPVGVEFGFEGVDGWRADDLGRKTVPVVYRPYSKG